MDFTIILSIISIISVILSLFNSITNFITTKKEMDIKIKMTNKDISFNKIDVNNLPQITNLSLDKLCKDVVDCFEKISKQNKYTVSIFKIIDNNKVKKISSSSDFDRNHTYNINENIEFYETINTRKPYYINNISYFNKHGKKYFNSNPNWINSYQSVICCPIMDNNATIGFLIVEIMKPLNDLIDIESIIDFLQKECILIVANKEFNTFNSNNGQNVGALNENYNNVGFSECYQWDETVSEECNNNNDN